MNIKTLPMPKPCRTLAQHLSHPVFRKVLFEPGSYYTADQLAARDAQWLEMVRPVVEALGLAMQIEIKGELLLEQCRAALRNITED